ncbi:MAG: hypothetical protein QNJ46_04250 [Leptolyngbyaceae cyanobacterium MO_188.B28]|nr:hypothetical protein [Leptolyngbyaceae cyanobacterium MO_188.B28]
MSDDTLLLIDAPLVADPDADEELGPDVAEPIADEDLRGSRLLLARRVVTPIEINGESGGLVELSCTFQPAYETRFTWARLTMMLKTPAGIRIAGLEPRAIQDPRPVKFTVDDKGTLGLKYAPTELGVEQSIQKEYEVYHCAVQGSGIGTAKARWDFRENEHRQDGLGTDQGLLLTLPVTGRVSGLVLVNARLARSGVGGVLSAVRDMILGAEQRDYSFSVEIPEK